MKIAVLTGGVGGAKFVLGLTRVMPPDSITAIVNTGDDFTHLGLHISPDVDTLLYTLSGRADEAKGWGRASESWSFMAALRELGGPDWFALGDGDLALHVVRSCRLAAGDCLSSITHDFARSWGIRSAILPMSDRPVRTMLDTEAGQLEFQRYFVEQKCVPRVRRISFDGAEQADPAPGVIEAITSSDMIFIAPSNPFLSIDPILAVPQIREALKGRRQPVVAVSPIVEGAAVKGPTAKLMHELGMAISNDSVAGHYSGLIDALLVHRDDACEAHGIIVGRTDTLMHDIEDKIRVARETVSLGRRVGAA